MRKSWKFMIGTLVVLLLIYVWVKNYTISITDMSPKVGSRVGGGELSIKDNAVLKAYLELYKNYILEGEYEKAYNMTGYSYRKYLSYDEYVEKVKNQNFENLIFENIEPATTLVYDATSSISGEKCHYSILYNDEKNLYIYPDSFLDYAKLENKVSKKKLEIKLEYYIASIDKCVLGFNIQNSSNDIIEISNSKLVINENDFFKNDEKITLNPKESKKVVLEFDTDYSIPKQVILYRSTDKEDTFIEYNIEIKK